MTAEEPADHTLELLRRMDGKLDRLDERLTGVGTDLGDMNRRLTSFEATSRGMAEDVRFVRNTMGAMERAHAAQVETSATLMERMEQLDERLAMLTRRVDAVENDG